MIAFISGGARSGKSNYAEQLALRLRQTYECSGDEAKLLYIATSTMTDPEMQARIEVHRQSRSDQWSTIEVPYDLHQMVQHVKSWSVNHNGQVSTMRWIGLIDCLTVWLSNAMFTAEQSEQDILSQMSNLIQEARTQSMDLILVSNDLNESSIPDDAFVQTYVQVLQKLHIAIVDAADTAIQMHAGVPLIWKGKVEQ